MAGLAKSTILTLARGLVDVSSSDQFFSTALMDVLADEANRTVYRLLCDASSEYFETVTSFSWPANAEKVDVSNASYLNAEPYRILSIGETTSSGAVSPSNKFKEWRLMRLSERAVYLASSEYSAGRHYVLQGINLYCAPIPTATTYVQVHWIPQLAALSGDSDQVLGGLAEPFGSAVAYYLAVLMNSKQEDQNPAVSRLWAQAQEDIANHASKRSYGPKFVRHMGQRVR